MARKFDRSAFKTSNSLAQQEKELESKIKSNNFSSPDIIEFKEDGEYLIRFWPTPVKDSYFMLPDMIHFMKMERDVYDDDNNIVKDAEGNVEKEVKIGVIKNSVVHGNTAKDVIDEYIEFAKKQAGELYPKDKAKRDKYLKHINGFKPQGGKYVGGIKSQLHYIAYGSVLKKQDDGTYKEIKFGRIKIKQSIRSQMLIMAAGGDQASTDPFSDPEEGFIMKVIKDSVAGKKDMAKYYQTSWEQVNFVPVKWPIPFETLEAKFEDMVTLPELYENKYTGKTFDRALDGLQRFDKEHEYNLFSFDEFLNTLEEISEYYPEEDEEATEEVTEEVTEEAPNVADSKKAMEAETEEVVDTEEKEESPFEKEEEKAAVEAPKATGTKLSMKDKLAEMKKKIAATSTK